MEKDEEMHNFSSTSYDFGARLYDARVGRWLSLDPKAQKYAPWSAYHFGFCNPITTIDPNGQENIVIAGAQYDTKPANKLMFVNQSMRKLKEYAKNEPNETLSFVIFSEGYTPKQLSRMTAVAQKRYGATVVVVNSTAELANYINSKDVNSNATAAREADPITSLDMFAHGTVGKVRFGYSTPIEAQATLGVTELTMIRPDAFDKDAVITSYACRTGIGVDGEDFKLF